jgi:hypothetical protein
MRLISAFKVLQYRRCSGLAWLLYCTVLAVRTVRTYLFDMHNFKSYGKVDKSLIAVYKSFELHEAFSVHSINYTAHCEFAHSEG